MYMYVHYEAHIVQVHLFYIYTHKLLNPSQKSSQVL